MTARPHVVVIGAGVIGLNAAWRLAEAGAAVTVVEAGQPGSGTSRTSFAWLNASSKVDAVADYFALNAAALDEHAALHRRPGAPAWAQFTGDVEIAPDATAAAALARKVERLRAAGYQAALIAAAELAALEPGTVLPAGGAAAFYAAEGWADVAAFVAALLVACRDAGVTIVTDDPAAVVVQTGRRVARVRLGSGVTVAADAVVMALGRWTPGFAAALGLAVPLVAPEPPGSKALGLLARVRPAAGAPRRLLHSPAINWSPLAEGRALLASDGADAAVAEDRRPAVAAAAVGTLVAAAAERNPLFAGALVEDIITGIRALPSDGVTICGWVRDVPGLYLAVTHSGVTLSPLLGRWVAREIVGGEAMPMLRRFRPDRFGAAVPAGDL